ncbi:MAG: EmrB/QacA subfamily drug resistance transporter [Candidatus Poriferisodalaceae bacterium]
MTTPGNVIEIPKAAWRTLAITSIVGFMVSLEITVISLARAEIAEAFPNSSPSTLSWVITAYNIGVASLLLPSGWTADRHGRKRLFLWGLGVFVVGSFLSGVAPSAELLIAARVLQSIGGALQFPAGLALLLTAFPIQRRQMAIGIWGAMGGLAAAVGPSLGALLVDAFGWRAVFLINVPVALGALIIAPKWLTESVGESVPGNVDLISVPLASLGVGAFVLGIVQGTDWGWTSGRTLGVFSLGVVLIAVFVFRSNRHPRPLFDLALLRLPTYSIGNLGSVFFVVAFFGWLVVLPEFIQRTWEWSVLKTGFAIAPGPVIATVLSPITGRLADRIGNGPILMVGGVAGAIGALLHLVLTDTDPNYLGGLLLPGIFIGISAGCSFAMLVGATMRDVQPRQFGMAGAGRTTIFQLAIAIAVAIAISFIGRPASSAEFLAGIQKVWILSLVLWTGQALVFAFIFPKRTADT